jgi:hypothetical protein
VHRRRKHLHQDADADREDEERRDHLDQAETGLPMSRE